MQATEIKKTVREGYAKIAKHEGSCCAPGTTSCGSANLAASYDKAIGYTAEELEKVPEGARTSLGSGNPIVLAKLQAGETVLDLGAGSGLDCLLAAEQVGNTGQVIGVDMTPEMVDRARVNADKGGYTNVEFRLGEIESLPAADQSVNVIISNCVINLSPDKPQVFAEAFRVLKPGGRMVISDVVLSQELPAIIKASTQAYIGCVSGAMLKNEYIDCIKAAGFQEVEVLGETAFPFECLANDPIAKTVIDDNNLTPDEAQEMSGNIISLKIRAYRPES